MSVRQETADVISFTISATLGLSGGVGVVTESSICLYILIGECVCDNIGM